MCAIVDASVTYEVFGQRQTDAGSEFRKWLDDGPGVLVVGGRNLTELNRNNNFNRWFQEARRLGNRVRQVSNELVSQRQQALVESGGLRSNDPHMVALAQVSGARLLYSNDIKLTQDFQNGNIVDGPQGKIYSTLHSKEFSISHRQLLQTENLCG